MKRTPNSAAIESIRREVLRRVHLQPESFDARDIEALTASNWTIRKFLTAESSAQDVVEHVLDFLTWRHEQEINDLSAEDFPLCFYSSGIVSLLRTDGERRSKVTIGFIRTNVYRRFAELTPSLSRFLVFLIEKMEKMTKDHRSAVLVIDLGGATWQSVDIGLLTTVLPILINFYPNLFKAVKIVDVPFVLKATAMVALRAVPDKYRRLIQFVDRKSLVLQLGLDRLPPWLGGTASADLELVTPRTAISLKCFAERHAIGQKTVDAALDYFTQGCV